MQESSYIRKRALKQDIASLDAEITSFRSEITQLEEQCKLRTEDKRRLMQELKALDQHPETVSRDGGHKGKGRAIEGIDYTIDFDWSKELKAKMKKVFGINEFRLCQKGWDFISC
jgi:ATP-dependent DNA helicase Q1